MLQPDPTAEDCIAVLLQHYQQLLNEKWAASRALQKSSSQQLEQYSRDLVDNRKILAPIFYRLREYHQTGDWKRLFQSLQQEPEMPEE